MFQIEVRVAAYDLKSWSVEWVWFVVAWSRFECVNLNLSFVCVLFPIVWCSLLAVL